MSILKAILLTDGPVATTLEVDVISHAEKLWLVPNWLEVPSAGYKIPERIVCLDRFEHQLPCRQGENIVVNATVPKAVLFDPIRPEEADAAQIVLRPEIRFPIPRGIH